MTRDLNEFTHAGSEAVGCHTGVHDYETDVESNMGPRMEADGELTAMVMTCKRCRATHKISSPLGLNTEIARAGQIDASRGVVQSDRAPRYVPPTQQIPQPQQQPQHADDDVLRKLFG